ncbi:hypothetical protein V5P93_004445 [Actinokineospora auranticolor]|uniref:Uncharacterized protein n=1 Tax=Actinokineospora auranticolor TaxID=155976 RepID=A0A2S6GT64_9PSEU|nr:hypothetical protein [Actinokineospora auranticolor]PPK68448.1 hypothetical protein CLV40_105171 [Actinokineospora auranticolor]
MRKHKEGHCPNCRVTLTWLMATVTMLLAQSGVVPGVHPGA